MKKVSVSVLVAGWLLGALAPPVAADLEWKFWKRERGEEGAMGSREVRQALKDADEYLAEGQLSEARALYEEVVSRAPEDEERLGDALYGVAIVSLAPFRSVRDLDRARAALLQLSDSYPEHPRKLEVAVALSWMEQLERLQAQSGELRAKIEEQRRELVEQEEKQAEKAEKASGARDEASSEIKALRAQLAERDAELTEAREELEKLEVELARKEAALKKVQQALVGKQGS